MAHSPLSASTTSGRWADDSASSSDDEIVWEIPSSFSPSSSSASSEAEPHSDSDADVAVVHAATPSVRSDDDFILLSRAGSPSPELAAALEAMSLSATTNSTGFSLISAVSADAAQMPEKLEPAPAPTVAAPQPKPASPKKKKKSKKEKAEARARREAKAEAKAKKAEAQKAQGLPKKQTATTPTQKSASALYPSPPSSPAENRSTAPPLSKKAKKRAAAAAAAAAAQNRGSVVDDTSSIADSSSDSSETESPAYTEAAKYMTSYLQNPPPPGNNGSALLLLQALIVELGVPLPAPKKPVPQPLALPALPRTVTQAKRLLKAAAFINIADYVAVRGRGQAALRRAMHPSRASLVREIRGARKGAGAGEGAKRVPLGWVKSVGLNVLLVHTRC